MTETDGFRILLVYPNIGMSKMPSLAMGLLTAALKRAGITVALFDGANYPDEGAVHEERRIASLAYRPFDIRQTFAEVGNDLQGDFRRCVDAFKPDLVAFSILEGTWRRTRLLLAAVRDCGIPVVCGGVLPGMAPLEVLQEPGIDMLVVGDGEKVIVDICERLRRKESPRGLPGVWTREADGTLHKPETIELADIDALIPDYSLVAEDQFRKPMGGRVWRMIPLEASRGCPFNCSYCNSPAQEKLARGYGHRRFLRYKSIAALERELVEQQRACAPEFIFFTDDSFLSRPQEEFDAFCMMYRKIGLPFFMNTRIESVTAEKLAALRDCGCFRMSFGLEHGNEEFRRQCLGKKFDNAMVRRGVGLLRDSGIPFSINVMIGFPEETRALVFDTIELARDLQGYDALTVSIFTPFRGTVLRERLLARGWLDPAIIPAGLSEPSLLRMPPPFLQVDEIEGLFRTFALYAYFPRERWPEIAAAERMDEAGTAAYRRLSVEYQQCKYGNGAA